MRDRADERVREREEVDEDVPGEPFADPYTRLDRGVKASYAFWSRRQPRFEFTWEKRNLPATPMSTAIVAVINAVKNAKISPRDFPTLMVELLDEGETGNLATFVNVLGAFVYGKLYREQYCDPQDLQTIEDRWKKATIGLVCSGPVTTQMLDQSKPIDDRTRSNGPQGSSSQKRRFFLMTDVDGDDVEIAFVTGFSSKEAPPHSRMYQYVYLTQDIKDQVPRVDVIVVKFSGNKCLTKLSYLQVARRMWVGLAQLPYKVEGEMLLDCYEPLADKMKLPPDCGLRMTAECKRREHMASLRMDESAWMKRATRFGLPHGLSGVSPHPPDSCPDQEKDDDGKGEMTSFSVVKGDLEAAV